MNIPTHCIVCDKELIKSRFYAYEYKLKCFKDCLTYFVKSDEVYSAWTDHWTYVFPEKKLHIRFDRPDGYVIIDLDFTDKSVINRIQKILNFS